MLRTLLPFIIILPALAYSILSLLSARRFLKSPIPRLPSLVMDVTILKPIKGMDEDSYANFASFCNQEFPANVQVLFAAASAEDPVIPIIQRLIEDFPNRDISLIINPALHGPNHKVSNLINVFSKAKHDIIIICDSDIRVPPNYLSRVVAHFDDPQIGLVTSPYRTSHVHGLATAVEATGFTTEMIPNVMVALQLEGLSFALGASMAVRREALAAIGGFKALADYLADDYQLGNKVYRAGWHLALDSCFVESMMKAENLATVFSRQLRWARTMRISRPGGYLASGITFPFPAVVLAAFLAADSISALTAIGLLYAVRLMVSTHFSRTLVKDNLLPRWLWLIPLRDMLAFISWALSFMGNNVEWRGNHFRLKPGGKLEEII